MSSRKLLNFPYEIYDVDSEINAELIKMFTGQPSGYVKVGPKGYFLPKKYEELAADIYNFPLRPDDVWIVTYPRSGTTWTQELIWLIANDLDYSKAAEIKLIERFPHLEFSILFDPILVRPYLEKIKDDKESREVIMKLATTIFDQLAQQPSPRFIKTHLPLSLLPPSLLDTNKVVYVARDPRDVAVSFYHLSRLLSFLGYGGDFKTFWNHFINDLIIFSPFFQSVKEAWEKRNHPNMLFLFYEELLKDLPAAIRRVSTFLGKQYPDEQIAKLSEHLHIDNFKKNISVNPEIYTKLNYFVQGEQPFIRKGHSGGWGEYFDEEMSAQAQRWMEENLRDTDLRFPAMDPM